jgi:hypothetical protein
MIAVKDGCTTVNATPTFTRFIAENSRAFERIDSADDPRAKHIAAELDRLGEVLKKQGCRAFADQMNGSDAAKTVGWVLFSGF